MHYRKAFDCVDCEMLWIVLKGMGVPQHMSALCCEENATVRTVYELTEWFPKANVSDKGAFYFLLFNLHAEHIIWKPGLDSYGRGMKIGGRNINDI